MREQELRSGIEVNITTQGVASTIECKCTQKQNKKKGHSTHISYVIPPLFSATQPFSLMGLNKKIGWKNYVGNNLFAMGLLHIGLGYQGSLDICGFLGMGKP